MSSDVKATSSSRSGAAVDDSPFLPGAVNSNPAFNPKKFNSNSVEYKMPKPPKPPEKPLMPYMRYSRKIWDSVKRDNGNAKLWEIGKIIGQMWRSLPDADRQRYTDEYEAEKVTYGESFKSYQNSPAYQQYMAAKERADQKDKESRGKQNTKFESKVTIQPCDEQEFADDAVLTSRHVAAIRYERNQLLLAEIFSEACVPDLRTVVANGRMATLKKQVQSLNMHQKKLEAELGQLEDKFRGKKRRILDATDAFNETVAKMAKPAIDDVKLQQMVDKASEDLLARYRVFSKGMEERAKLTPADEQSLTTATTSKEEQVGQGPPPVVAPLPADGAAEPPPVVPSGTSAGAGTDPGGICSSSAVVTSDTAGSCSVPSAGPPVTLPKSAPALPDKLMPPTTASIFMVADNTREGGPDALLPPTTSNSAPDGLLPPITASISIMAASNTQEGEQEQEQDDTSSTGTIEASEEALKMEFNAPEAPVDGGASLGASLGVSELGASTPTKGPGESSGSLGVIDPVVGNEDPSKESVVNGGETITEQDSSPPALLGATIVVEPVSADSTDMVPDGNPTDTPDLKRTPEKIGEIVSDLVEKSDLISSSTADKELEVEKSEGETGAVESET